MDNKGKKGEKKKKKAKIILAKPISSDNVSIQSRYNEPSYVNLYDSRYRDLQWHKFEQLFQKSSLPHDMILDIGTGTGLLWTYLIEKVILISKISKLNKKKQGSPRYCFIGVDFAWEMLRSFREKIHQNQVNFALMPHLICADGEHLPFRGNLFCEIYSVSTMHNLSDPIQGLREIHRISLFPVRIGITILRKKMGLDMWINLLRHEFVGAEFVFVSSTKENNYEEDWITLFQIFGSG